MSPKFSFNKENAIHTAKVFGWSFGSSLIALAIALLADVKVPEQYVLFVPIVNTLLVSLDQFFREQKQGV
jgi:hypothetical protein